ncbi:MAG: prepilin-type N-terminal cleavage/methylation domain-containing protein [bacterium]
MKNNKPTQPKNGFTLMEVLVVISIFVILIVLIFSIYILCQKAYYVGDTKAEIDQNGRIAFDKITREIRQAKEIVTELPETNDNPANEIIFEDGHNVGEINYIRYYLKNGAELWRQIIFYYFDPPGQSVHVRWNSEDQSGDPPDSVISEDKLIAEYFQTLEFYQPNAINLYAELMKNNHHLYLTAKVFGRNLR